MTTAAPVPVLAPDGAFYLRAAIVGEPTIADEPVARRVAKHFARGADHGHLLLGAAEPGTALPPAYAWLRDLARAFVTRLCALPDLDADRAALAVPLAPETAAALLARVPPMAGAEHASADWIALRWDALTRAARAALAAHDGPALDWLRALSPLWNTVGRVCFHLAERRGDAARPFAFLATYTAGVSAAAAVQHLPLGRALQEYAGARDRSRLVALLAPIERAAERSPVVRALVDSQEIFHPLAWSPAQAHAFLRQVAECEAAGVLVRLPNWWNPARPPRPRVQVAVGAKGPSHVGASALLDFDVTVALDDDTALTAEEIAALRHADGLVLLRGRWVEVDPARLQAVLDQWKTLQRAAKQGVPFHEGLRLLAGARAASSDEAPDEADATGAWQRVEAGPWLREVLADLRDPSRLGDTDPGPGLRATLRGYQQEGLRWLWFVTRLGLGACLADDMGLGKTVQVIALMVLEKRARKAKEPSPPHLLVVPASLLGNWKAEFERFAPSLRVVIAHPSAMARKELDSGLSDERPDVVVTTYGTLPRVEWLRTTQWNLLVLDEAQAIKNPDTRQSRTVKSVAARARLALTGTPVENRAGDLWSLFDFLQPGLLGTARAFSRVARRAAESDDGAAAWGPVRALVRPWLLRRLKTDRSVVNDLPDKTELTAYCALTPAQAKLYAGIVDELRRRLEDPDLDPQVERRGVVLAALMRFKQVCNHPSQLTGDGQWAEGDSGKYARLREIAEVIAERGEKVLVFSQFQEMTGPLAAYLETVFGRPGLTLHGATPVAKRAKLVKSFQEDPSVPFFVLSLKAGGTGLNLTAAQHVVHFDRWWNPAVEDQATDRAYRIGQKRNVLVHRFVCRGTLEERIDAMLTGKRAVADALLTGGGGDGAAMLTKMSDDELLSTVALDLARATEE
ncbi:MAG: helZ [Myxococcaceae bacterium]|nr:helZ [Myxococcaceae bacterium]